MKLYRAIVAGLILMSGSAEAHQLDWPEEVCKQEYFDLTLEDRKNLWSGGRRVHRGAIALSGVRTEWWGKILVSDVLENWKKGKVYWIPADQYAMLVHCFSYPPHLGN